MKINIYLCEGPHDVAFLYRIFRVCGFNDISSELIKKLPFPFDKHFESILKNFEYQSGNIFGKPALPIILKNNESYILLYGVGGVTKVPETKRIINNYIALLNSSTLNRNKEIESTIAFIVDADNEGIENRTNDIAKNFAETFSKITQLQHNNIIEDDNFKKVGLYIFCDETKQGKLEDIILPLMKLGNENIFEGAKNYFQEYFDKERLKKPNNAELAKSQIGIAGQLQFSGVANNNIIKQSDYLTDIKISTNKKCIEIIEFITKMKI